MLLQSVKRGTIYQSLCELDFTVHVLGYKWLMKFKRYLLSTTGQTKQALSLITSSLGDVSYAISFAKEQSDDDLWNDLLDYSMDKPHFIRALLEEVGTSINPVTLVRRIPEGLEIEGLPEGIRRMMRDFEIQSSISEGAAKVLRSDVAAGMELLRAGQRKAVRFEVAPDDVRHRDAAAVSENSNERSSKPVATAIRVNEGEDAKSGGQIGASTLAARKAIRPGYCMICGKRFAQGGKCYYRYLVQFRRQMPF